MIKEGTKVLVYGQYEGIVIRLLGESKYLVRFNGGLIDCFTSDDLQERESRKNKIITTGKELEEYIYEEYRKDDTELNSLYFDIEVCMKESEILESYAKIQHAINGDDIIRIKDGKEMGRLIEEGEYNNIFSGNCKDFLESFNAREAETGLYRYFDDEKLDFIL